MTAVDGELVSVIVPAYNAAATLSETLEFALAQTYQDLEVVVVDDGSTDPTPEIVASFAERDRRVRLLRQSNAGVAAARNLAIAQSRGSYVAPLDADDLWHPEKLAYQVAAMRQRGRQVGVVYCWRRVIDVAGHVIGEDRLWYPHEGRVLAAVLLGNVPGNGSVPLIRREDLLNVGGFDTTLRRQGAQGCEDLEIYVQLAERCEFALVPLFLVGYRARPQNMSSDPRRISRSHKLVLIEARQRHPELPGWLFRVGEARFKYRQAASCLRDRRSLLALALLLTGIEADPAGIAYRLAEGPCRAASRHLPARLNRVDFLSAADRGTRRHHGAAGYILSYCAQFRRTERAGAAMRAASRDQPKFLTLPAEPRRDARICSSLYVWRCELLAVSVATRHRSSSDPKEAAGALFTSCLPSTCDREAGGTP